MFDIVKFVFVGKLFVVVNMECNIVLIGEMCFDFFCVYWIIGC